MTFKIPFDHERIILQADQSMKIKPMHITDVVAPLSEGGIHDFYSNGDYWWPNHESADGLPYVRRDGESNPEAFNAHRHLLRTLRTNVANLAAGYVVTGDDGYVHKAVQLLQGFFLDEDTRMNPHLLYAQAIPGICSGRGIGIIDTLHIAEVPAAIEAMKSSPAFPSEVRKGIQKWFGEYLTWMSTHEYGIDEMNAENNHGVCWYVQAAIFARFTGDESTLNYCLEQYKTHLLPNQMAMNGSFPRELSRTKPYGYSIFVLDNMTTLCHVLSTVDENIWSFQLADGRGIRKGFEFLYPYLEDKSKWPYARDVQHFEEWPVRVSMLLFAGEGLKEQKYLALWEKLKSESENDEVRRNIAIRQPILW